MRSRRLAPGVLAATAALALVGLPGVAAAAPAATAADIVINEVESNGDATGDWVELANTNTTESLDISGWSIVDNDPTHARLVLPAGTVIESGGYFSFYTDVTGGFGLGGNDSVTLFDAQGNQVDTTAWTTHSTTTWGRIPDMTGDFVVTPEATRNLANGGTATPPTQTTPFPGDPLTQVAVALGGDFTGEDMSGVDVDAQGNAYVVNNGTGTLYVLTYDKAAGTYTLAKTFVLKYADGSGIPDAEGVTIGKDGAVYVATERDNSNKSVSRPSLLRFDVPATGDSGELKAAAEYNLSSVTGTIGANAGLEAVEYIPHAWGGVYAVGVEGTGDVHFVQPQADGTVVVKQTFDSPFEGVMALDYDTVTKKLHVVCDEVCEGQSVDLTFDGTQFTTDGTVYARPAGTANNANEGFASFHERVSCTKNGQQGTGDVVRYLWTDDAAADGAGLRTAITAVAVCDVPSDPQFQGSLSGGSLGDLGGGSTGSSAGSQNDPELSVTEVLGFGEPTTGSLGSVAGMLGGGSDATA